MSSESESESSNSVSVQDDGSKNGGINNIEHDIIKDERSIIFKEKSLVKSD